MPRQLYRSLRFLPSVLADQNLEQPFFVVVARSGDEFLQWLSASSGACNGSKKACWTIRKLGLCRPLPLLKYRSTLSFPTPSLEIAELYRLVDLCAVRDVRVSVPAVPGFSKAVKRLACRASGKKIALTNSEAHGRKVLGGRLAANLNR
jgi:hypothetical protein